MNINPEVKKKTLEVFVTSAEDQIYAVRSSVPPEVFGAFGSYFSRNPKDFREHLWEAITGQIDEQETEVTEEHLKWLVDGSLREPYEAIKKGLSVSQGFFKKWYGKYSHKSIANTVWIPMVMNNVSQLVAKELAYDQLAFFIEQSTRFVKFDSENMFRDPNVMKSSHADLYNKTLEHLARSYDDFTEEATDHYREQIPFKTWLKLQKENILKKSDDFKQRKYEREVKAKALDVSRFLLPQAIKTNIAYILDARSTEFDISTWKLHPLQEVRDTADLIEKHAGQIAPSLLKYTESNEYYGDKLNGYGGKLITDDAFSFKKGASIISYENDALNKVIGHILKRYNRGGTFDQRYEHVKRMSFGEKMAILERITSGREPHDEWVETDEDFDLVKTTLEIRTDIGATRDWRRHQKWDRGEPIYTLDNGYHLPHMVNDMSNKAKKIFEKSMELAHDAEKRIRTSFPHEAQYVIPMAANHAITMSAGLDQLQYMLWTRSTPQGNFSYREDAFNIAEAITKVHPWLIGYEKYPEGKEFQEVYKNAPLKKLLPLQTGETGLHQ